jgi:hypothetical protein
MLTLKRKHLLKFGKKISQEMKSPPGGIHALICFFYYSEFKMSFSKVMRCICFIFYDLNVDYKIFQINGYYGSYIRVI